MLYAASAGMLWARECGRIGAVGGGTKRRGPRPKTRDGEHQNTTHRVLSSCTSTIYENTMTTLKM